MFKIQVWESAGFVLAAKVHACTNERNCAINRMGKKTFTTSMTFCCTLLGFQIIALCTIAKFINTLYLPFQTSVHCISTQIY